MKGSEIFSIKAISNAVTGNQVPGLYFRLYDTNRGQKGRMTKSAILEVVSIIKANSSEFINELITLAKDAPDHIEVKERPKKKKTSKKRKV